MASPLSATNAYAAISRIADPTSAGAGLAKSIANAAGEGGGFGQMLKDTLASVAESGRKSDAQAKGLATGKADIVNVVTAVAETEVAIDAVVSVRDKVIQAYEDIMKMPI
jgi:flagellar hook-basal body complex protein FliE